MLDGSRERSGSKINTGECAKQDFAGSAVIAGGHISEHMRDLSRALFTHQVGKLALLISVNHAQDGQDDHAS